jgi:ABC-type oligopeptide transport system ATPase subunit
MTDILEINNLTQYFRHFKSAAEMTFVPFVRNISFKLSENEIFGIVGESGCGKTTLGRCLIGLINSVDGEIIYNNTNLVSFNGKIPQKTRTEIQMIFQNPRSALNMNMNVYELIEEAVSIICQEPVEIKKRIDQIVDDTKLQNILYQFPFQLSGGERRRVGVGRILALEPRIIIADEPVSSLDVSIKGLIVDLLLNYQKRTKATIVFITHDLHLINRIADRVGVMFKGRLLEVFSPKTFRETLHHPYTEELFNAGEFFSNIEMGDEHSIPDFFDAESMEYRLKGCPYFERCELHGSAGTTKICLDEMPGLQKSKDLNLIACHAYEKV